jgi:hypothetical protein
MALDGNAIGGLLLEIFGSDMTSAEASCAACGAVGPVAETGAAPPARGHSATLPVSGVTRSAAFRGVLVAPAGGLGYVRADGYRDDREQPAGTG